MSGINVISAAKKRGIKLRGSWRTSRLKKKRLKHMEEIRLMVWAEIRERRAKELGVPVLPYIKGKTDVLGRPLIKKVLLADDNGMARIVKVHQ